MLVDIRAPVCDSCRQSWLYVPVLLAIFLAHVGCGQRKEGPMRYRVSGEVTYQGQAVPAGTITFEPDATQGIHGPALNLPIKNGEYSSDHNGVVGGEYRVVIAGYTGEKTVLPDGMELPDGKPLFAAYRTTIALPKENSVQKFDVPEKQAVK